MEVISMKKRVIVIQGLDERGEPEEFTFDLFPTIDSEQTLHLDESGLPKIGTEIKEGMILVGKGGASKDFSRDRLPTALEYHALSREELMEKYGHLWRITCHYADCESVG